MLGDPSRLVNPGKGGPKVFGGERFARRRAAKGVTGARGARGAKGAKGAKGASGVTRLAAG
jgi:hypothetical protein